MVVVKILQHWEAGKQGHNDDARQGTGDLLPILPDIQPWSGEIYGTQHSQGSTSAV